MASNGVTRPPALDVTMQEILDALKAVSFRPQVIDNLTSQDSGAPLSANQGRVLKDAIDDIVTQSITDGDTAHAPSGDAVHDALNAINDALGIDSYSFSGNDQYIRYNNGLQICWGIKTFSYSSWTSWGSLYETDNGTTIYFAKEFKDNKIGVSLRIDLPDGSATFSAESTAVMKNYISSVYAIRPSASGGVGTATIHYQAVGAWK